MKRILFTTFSVLIAATAYSQDELPLPTVGDRNGYLVGLSEPDMQAPTRAAGGAPGAGRAQDADILATVATQAPIFIRPGAVTPLRVAAVGTILKVLQEQAAWCEVEFRDPQIGTRVGWIETKAITISRPNLRPMDLSVDSSPAAAPAATSVETITKTAQAPAGNKSRSQGFFLGVNYEGTGVAFEEGDDVDSGNGFGVTAGYGFTPKLALYAQFSGSSMEDGVYAVGHFDIGLRTHFRAPAKTVVPFLQIGLSSRALVQDDGFDELKASGFGFAFGLGLNAHFNPAVAFTAGITWSVGSLGNYELNGVNLDLGSDSMTTARIHVGIIFFVQKPK